jgi:hypothetical protein
MTRPATSSIIATPLRTVTSLDLSRPVVERIVNVVPMFVEHSAAPAPNAWRGVASIRRISTNDRAIGVATPVNAAIAERRIFAFSCLNDVESQPVLDVSL